MKVLNIFQCMGEYRRENAKHLFEKLMGEGSCQCDTLDKPSWGHELTCETIPIFVAKP